MVLSLESIHHAAKPGNVTASWQRASQLVGVWCVQAAESQQGNDKRSEAGDGP